MEKSNLKRGTKTALFDFSFFFRAGERYLCGIVSFGPGPPGCGTEPGSYTKVNHPANLAFISSIADLEPVVKTDWITDPHTFQFTGRNEKSSKVQLVSWSVHLQVELVVTMKILVSYNYSYNQL